MKEAPGNGLTRKRLGQSDLGRSLPSRNKIDERNESEKRTI